MSSSLWRVEAGKLRLAFHPGQAAAWKSERRIVAMLAGTQSGKTSFGPWWLSREINQCGAGDYLAVSSSYDLFKLKLLPELREVMENVLRRGRYWAGDRVMELADPDGRFLASRADDHMWGRIILRSAAADGGLESATAKAAWLDEAGMDSFTLEDFEAVLRRLALAQGRVLISTTPYNWGWLRHEVYERWAAGDPTFDVIQFSSVVNPSFPETEYERARATMRPHRFAMFYRGEFARPEGLIYECFSSELSVCDPFELPADWPRYVGIDPGGVNLAQVWLAKDPQARRYFLYRESLAGNMTTAEHVRRARELMTADGARVARWWGGAGSEDQFRTDWTHAGVRVEKPPVKDVEAGIDRVTALLKERRLLVFRSCAGILDEFGSYRRQLDAAGEPTEVIESKRHFHRLDALRYVAAGLAGDPQSRPGALPVLIGSHGWQQQPTRLPYGLYGGRAGSRPGARRR